MAIPVKIDNDKVKKSTGQLMGAVVSNGTFWPASFGITGISQRTIPKPSSPAKTLNSVLSNTKRRTIPPRDAPSATRKEISRRRPVKRTSNRFATLLQAINNTNETAARSVRKAGRKFPVASSGAVTTTGAQLLLSEELKGGGVD